MYTMLAEEPEEYSKEKILKTSEESQNNPDTALVAGASGKKKKKEKKKEKKRKKKGKGEMFVTFTKYTGTDYKVMLDTISRQNSSTEHIYNQALQHIIRWHLKKKRISSGVSRDWRVLESIVKCNEHFLTWIQNVLLNFSFSTLQFLYGCTAHQN